MLRAVLLSLFFASLAAAQVPPGYAAAYGLAQEKAQPLVIFVGIEGREIPGAVVMECVRFPARFAGAGAGVVVAVPNPAGGEYLGWNLPASATDAEIAALCARSKSAVTSRGSVREYVRDGKTYREYYDAPAVKTEPPKVAPSYTSPAPPAQIYTPPPMPIQYQFPQLPPQYYGGSYGSVPYCPPGGT